MEMNQGSLIQQVVAIDLTNKYWQRKLWKNAPKSNTSEMVLIDNKQRTSAYEMGSVWIWIFLKLLFTRPMGADVVSLNFLKQAWALMIISDISISGMTLHIENPAPTWMNLEKL